MPFVQMENISHFLSFVSRPPVSLPPHDLFLTIDLYEQKDPAQVCQCISSFSRIAHKLNPTAFPTTVGGLGVPARLTPQLSGGASGLWNGSAARKVSGGSNGSTSGGSMVSGYSGTGSNGKPAVPARKPAVSTWSKSSDEGATLPAWNIAQYGYMGGASQGNQGISFGARRQITSTPVVKGGAARSTSPAPVSIFADREKRRKEEETKRREAEEARQRELEIQADGRRRAVEDARKWREEEEERAAMEIEHKKWREEESKRKLWLHEQERQRESERKRELLAAERRDEETRRAGELRDREAQLRLETEKKEREKERERIRQLERELEKARERERIYEAEKEERRRQDTDRMRREAQGAVVRRHRTGETPSTPSAASFVRSHKTGDRDQEPERIFMQNWRDNAPTPPPQTPTHQTPINLASPPKPQPRALPTPPRKLPPAPTNRASAVQASKYFAAQPTVHHSRSWESNDDAAGLEREREEQEKKEQAYKWARFDPVDPSRSRDANGDMQRMSLLERERERERERQREWEMNQRELESMQVDPANGEDPAWDVNQYGYADDILDLY